MDIAIGLPAAIPGVDRESPLEWARRAEARGFSSLGTIDRITYPNFEPLIALSAAAAVTERIRLATTILLAPTRNTAVLAKQAATIDVISNGRLTLGLAPGGREPDFEAAGVDFSTRGKRFEQQLGDLKRIWSDHQIGPDPVQPGGPPIWVGGGTEVAFRRAAEHGEGWIAGGVPPDVFKEAADGVRKAWEDAGREGEPRLAALAYFSLGDGAEEHAENYLKDYYAWLGEFADVIAGSAAKSSETAKQYVAGFEAVGCDELFFMPAHTDPAQVDLLADAVL